MKFFGKRIENGSERDRLTIKRDGLLKKKRLLDAVDKLRQTSPKGGNNLETTCSYISRAIKETYFTPMKSLLDSVSSPNAITFNVDPPDSLRGDPWGFNPVEIYLGKDFDNLLSEIREEYHDLNKKLGKSSNTQGSQKTTKEKWHQTGLGQIFIGVLVGLIILILGVLVV